MNLTDLPPVDVRPLLMAERRELLALLEPVDESEWTKPTAVPGWRVKDIALHVLDDDLGWLSRERDGDTSSLLDVTVDYRSFVGALAEKNQSWVAGAFGLSHRVVCGLLEWSGRQVDQYFSTIDMEASTRVSWAGPHPVPTWFDLARDMTERWVHHQQIRDAVQRSGQNLDSYLDVVLRTFVWAFPHQYTVGAEPGTQVAVDLGDTRRWLLTREATTWVLDEGTSQSAAARVSMSGDTAWRMFTGGAYDPTLIISEGDVELVQAVLRVRGIIV